MSATRTRKHRRDANHRELTKTLERLGWQVVDLSQVGKGVPDLLVCRRGDLRVIEVKSEQGELTPAQKRLLTLGWPVVIVRTVDDCVNLQ